MLMGSLVLHANFFTAFVLKKKKKLLYSISPYRKTACKSGLPRFEFFSEAANVNCIFKNKTIGARFHI
jgi:hypothetical protein